MQKKTWKQYTAEFKAKLVKEMLKEEKTVGQLAAEYEVHTNMLYPGPNRSLRAQQAAIFPYLFANVTANAPNHIWGIDITYIRLRAGWMYAGFDPGLVLAFCCELGTRSNHAERFRDGGHAAGTGASHSANL